MRRPSRRQLTFDILIALVLGTVAMLITAHFLDNAPTGDRNVDGLALTLVAIAFAALSVRRRWPLVTLTVATAASTAYLLETFPYGPILVAFFIAVYTVANLLSLKTAGIAVFIALVVFLTHVWVHPSALGGVRGLIPGSAWAVVPFAIGTTVRMSRGAKEAARMEAVRQQLSDERIRLAEEVHDIVGHGLAAIQMQADIALHVDEQQTPKTRTALESISRASAEAFEELRSTLDLMSRSRGAIRSPAAPDLDDIEELLERIRSAGVDVEMITPGDLPSLEPAVGLAAYRIVQESLTNVMRHGEIPSARIRISLVDDALRLVITNPGRASGDSGSGHGIRGMQRRAEAIGGTLHTGPNEKGFRVEATLPLVLE